jgi:hypothetical protein
MADETVTSVVLRLIDVLEASGEVYAFGGAIALAAWSEPRATADVDVILWVDSNALETAIELIRSAGVAIETQSAKAQADARGMFAGMAGPVRVDVFVPSIPFYAEAKARRVATTIAGRVTYVHSAEVLAVFKLLFFRPKDLLDVERMLQVQGAAFDREFVRRALVDMLDDTDTRIEKWDAFCERNPRQTGERG